MDERIRRRNLPHWDVPGAAYFITSCLAGSLPAQGILDLAAHRASLEKLLRPKDVSEPDWKTQNAKRQFARLDRWLDTAPAVRWLENADLANIVVDSFFHHAGPRYDLLAFAVMPSHVHWAFQPRPEWTDSLHDKRSPREIIVHAFNTHTAREANRLLARSGAFWQHEGYDHWIRDVDELERIILYIEDNPVKAGLVKSPEDFPYSSAYYRKLLNLPFGVPLLRPK